MWVWAEPRYLNCIRFFAEDLSALTLGWLNGSHLCPAKFHFWIQKLLFFYLDRKNPNMRLMMIVQFFFFFSTNKPKLHHEEAQWPIGYGVGLRIKRSSVRIRPWPLRWVLGQGSLLPLSQGEAFTLASISYLAILVKIYTGKKNEEWIWSKMAVGLDMLNRLNFLHVLLPERKGYKKMASEEVVCDSGAPSLSTQTGESRAPKRCKVCRVNVKEHFGPHGEGICLFGVVTGLRQRIDNLEKTLLDVKEKHQEDLVQQEALHHKRVDGLMTIIEGLQDRLEEQSMTLQSSMEKSTFSTSETPSSGCVYTYTDSKVSGYPGRRYPGKCEATYPDIRSCCTTRMRNAVPTWFAPEFRRSQLSCSAVSSGIFCHWWKLKEPFFLVSEHVACATVQVNTNQRNFLVGGRWDWVLAFEVFNCQLEDPKGRSCSELGVLRNLAKLPIPVSICRKIIFDQTGWREWQ